MHNFEKYNKLHNEIMKRLEAGEITIEHAKEVNTLAFEKYITEKNESNKSFNEKLEEAKNKANMRINRYTDMLKKSTLAHLKEPTQRKLTEMTDAKKELETCNNEIDLAEIIAKYNLE